MEKTNQKPLDSSTMTIEEIDKELEKGMRDIAEGRTTPARDFFKEFREEVFHISSTLSEEEVLQRLDTTQEKLDAMDEEELE